MTRRIACTGVAASRELTIDTTELDEARWFTREEVERAIRGGGGAPFQPPPRTAIARTLFEHWLGLEASQSRP